MADPELTPHMARNIEIWPVEPVAGGISTLDSSYGSYQFCTRQLQLTDRLKFWAAPAHPHHGFAI